MTISAGRTGGCQCGAIRYRLLAAPTALYACHCRLCQQQSASAFGMSMLVERDFMPVTGSPAMPTTFRPTSIHTSTKSSVKTTFRYGVRVS